MNTSMRIASGSTKPGETNWKQYEPSNPLKRGVWVDVDTTSGGFNKTPNYVISVCGRSRVWELAGTSAVYDPTPTGFRVYVRWSYNKPGQEAPPLTPAEANGCGWYVTWIGVEV
jgi:hypothetical protein